jgi:hypothetical protein
MKIFAFAFALAAGNAVAADTGELWEVSTVMNVPGMPAGMGSQKAQICREKDAPAGPPRNDCKISNHKRSGLTESMTVSCPRQDTMQIEMTYNAARTEYKGTMKSADMVINTSGRKLGACDPQVAQRQRDEKTAKMQAQGKAAQAEGARVMAQSRQQQLDGLKRDCGEAVSAMDYRKLAMPLCYGKDASMQVHCRSDVNIDAKSREMVMPAEGKAFCEAKRTEFCRNLQTEAGFTKAAHTEGRTAREDDEGKRKALAAAERIPASSQFCGLKKEAVVGGLCSKAVEGESWGFLRSSCPAESKSAAGKLCPRALAKEAYGYLGAYCPAEAKPLYTKNCAGRDYTSLYEKDKKLRTLCSELGLAMNEATDGRPRTTADSQKKAAAAPTTTESAAQQGINKIKGLFGR